MSLCALLLKNQTMFQITRTKDNSCLHRSRKGFHIVEFWFWRWDYWLIKGKLLVHVHDPILVSSTDPLIQIIAYTQHKPKHYNYWWPLDPNIFNDMVTSCPGLAMATIIRSIRKIAGWVWYQCQKRNLKFQYLATIPHDHTNLTIAVHAPLCMCGKSVKVHTASLDNSLPTVTVLTLMKGDWSYSIGHVDLGQCELDTRHSKTIG